MVILSLSGLVVGHGIFHCKKCSVDLEMVEKHRKMDRYIDRYLWYELQTEVQHLEMCTWK